MNAYRSRETECAFAKVGLPGSTAKQRLMAYVDDDEVRLLDEQKM